MRTIRQHEQEALMLTEVIQMFHRARSTMAEDLAGIGLLFGLLVATLSFS
jgi:hypothetical protein